MLCSEIIAVYSKEYTAPHAYILTLNFLNF
jgi:hypothetical protein